MKGHAKALAQRCLGPALRHLDVRNWPRWGGDLFDIKVPANVRTKSYNSTEGGANINILLHLIEQVRPLPGDFAECGVFRGSTLIPMALHAQQTRWPATIIGFDSFAGFDAAIAIDLALGGADDLEKRQGGFGATSVAYVTGRLAALGLEGRVELHTGYFESTLARATDRQYSLVHLDCDIYASYRQCLEYFYPRTVRGGVILLDEYDDPPWPGCNRAVDEFLAERPERPRPIERDGYEKFYILKA